MALPVSVSRAMADTLSFGPQHQNLFMKNQPSKWNNSVETQMLSFLHFARDVYFLIKSSIMKSSSLCLKRKDSVPENIMVAVDLLPFSWIIQYPTVPHHSTSDTLWFVVAILPVVQHLPVSRKVEDRKRLHQCCWHRETELIWITVLKNHVIYIAVPWQFCRFVIKSTHNLSNLWFVWGERPDAACVGHRNTGIHFITKR